MNLTKRHVAAWCAGWCILLAGEVAAQEAQSPFSSRYALRDQGDKPLSLTAYRGHKVLLNFIYTGCSSVCPLQSRVLAELQKQLLANRDTNTRILSVTVDPLNDNPAALKKFAAAINADLRYWTFATGKPDAVNRFVHDMRALDPRKTTPAPSDHTTTVFLFDEKGQMRQRFAGNPPDRTRILNELKRLDLATSLASR